MKQQRNTLQKRIVFDIFCSMNNHPSAGMVCEAVQAQYPGISRATVYRILAEAAEEGKIQRLKLTDATDRYDMTLGPHFHVTCRHCGAVADVLATEETAEHLGQVAERSKGCEGFFLEDVHLEFVGVCEKCQSKSDKN